MLQPGMQPVIPELGPPPPPRDPPPISHSTRSRPRRRMRMPEPEISSSEEGIPVVPGMNTPYASPNAPVIPGSRSRNGPVTPGPRFPQPQPQPPPPPNIPEPLPQFPVPDPRLASGQYDTPQESHPVRRATTPYHRPREHSEDHISHHRQYSQDQYPRHGDAHLREDPRERNPLPTPPKDVFERSPYVGLLDDLRRPPEETTLRRRTTGNHQIIIGTTLDPGPGPGPIPAPVIVPQDSRGTQSSGEKKQRKGLFRSLSSKLTSSRPKGEPASHSHHQHATSHHTHPVRPSPRPPTQIVYVTSESQSGVSPGPAYAYDSSPSHHHQRPPTPVRHISTPVPFVGPPSPAPSNRSRLSNRAQFTNPPGQAPALPPVIVTTANELAGLTPYSTHPVHHAGLRKVFPTAYHLFEALKFDFRPDVVDRIRKTKTLRELAGLLRDLQALLPRGWEERVLSMVWFHIL